MESLQKSCIALKAALNLWNLHSGQQILQFLIYKSKHEVTPALLKFQKKENEEFGFISLAEQMDAGLTAAMPFFSILNAAKITHKLDFGKSRQWETQKH